MTLRPAPRHLCTPRSRAPRRPIFRREDVEDAFDAPRVAQVDARDAAFGDGRGNDSAIGKAVSVEYAGAQFIAVPAALGGCDGLAAETEMWTSPQ